MRRKFKRIFIFLFFLLFFSNALYSQKWCYTFYSNSFSQTIESDNSGYINKKTTTELTFTNLYSIMKKNISKKMLATIIVIFVIVLIIASFLILHLKKIVKDKIERLKKEITEKENIYDNLLLEKKKLESIFNAIDDIFFEINNEFKFVDVITGDYSRLYKPKEEIINKGLDEIFPKDQSEIFIKKIKEVFKTNNKHIIEYSLKIGNETKWFEAILTPFKNDTILAVVKDVTQYKKNFETLMLFSNIIEQSLSIIVITDVNGIIEYANPKFFEVTGYGIDEVIGKNPRILKSGKHNEEFYKGLWNTIKSNKSWHDIFINRKRSGQLFWENASIYPVTNEKGKITHFFKVSEDITSLIEAESAIAKEKIKFETYLKNSNTLIVALDKNGKVKIANPKTCETLGYLGEEILEKDWIENFIPKEKRTFMKKYFKALFENPMTEKKQRKNNVLCKNGEEKTILWQNTILNIGDSPLILASGIDITKMERENKKNIILGKILYAVIQDLSLSEFYKKIRHELNKMFDASNMFIILKDDVSGDLKLVFNVDEKDNMTVLPKKRTISQYVLENRDSFYLTKSDIKRLLKEGKFDLVGALPEIWIGIPLKIKSETIGVLGLQSYSKNHKYSKEDLPSLEAVAYTIAVAIEFKKSEEIIKKDLEEKNMLLNEVHHRVKNNLQIILSVLKIQSYFIKDDKILDILKKDINRIRAMAILQGFLYKNNNILDIQIPLYVRRIIDNVISTYPNSRNIRFKFDIDDLVFDANLSLPLGILVNELVSNAIIHAFPDNHKDNSVEISLKKMTSQKDFFMLIVKDNGVGLPKDLDLKNPKSFGMAYIKMQTDELHGELEVKRERGTTVIIKFQKVKLGTFSKI